MCSSNWDVHETHLRSCQSADSELVGLERAQSSVFLTCSQGILGSTLGGQGPKRATGDCWRKEECTAARGAECGGYRDQESASPSQPQEQTSDVEVEKEGGEGRLFGIPVGNEVVPHTEASVSEVKYGLCLENCN